MPEWRPLKRKQTEDNAYWYEVWKHIGEVVSQDHIEDLLERTLEEAQPIVEGKKVAYAWSGGKDSQALRGIAERLGITLCMFGRCDLEYPAFVSWVEDHAPPGLETINTGQDMDWLIDHLDMLFPQNSKPAGRWFRIVQHTAQEKFYREQELDMILLGRRTQDGNYTGKNGLYTSRKGITRYSPIRTWTHEDILAYCHYYDVPLPPIYEWPNGFRVGTGAWPARQWTGSIENGWREVYSINPAIVLEAAQRIPSAQAFLKTCAAS